MLEFGAGLANHRVDIVCIVYRVGCLHSLQSRVYITAWYLSVCLVTSCSGFAAGRPAEHGCCYFDRWSANEADVVMCRWEDRLQRQAANESWHIAWGKSARCLVRSVPLPSQCLSLGKFDPRNFRTKGQPVMCRSPNYKTLKMTTTMMAQMMRTLTAYAAAEDFAGSS